MISKPCVDPQPGLLILPVGEVDGVDSAVVTLLDTLDNIGGSGVSGNLLQSSEDCDSLSGEGEHFENFY